MWELLKAGKLDGGAPTVTGATMADNLEGREAVDREVILPYDKPMQERAGFLVMKGNLFDFAIMKMSVISDAFRKRYLMEPGHEGVFEGKAVIFDGSEDYHARINDPALDIDERTILVIRGAGPLGWRRPCSQLSKVPFATPMLRANSACDRPVFARMATTSTCGTWT